MYACFYVPYILDLTLCVSLSLSLHIYHSIFPEVYLVVYYFVTLTCIAGLIPLILLRCIMRCLTLVFHCTYVTVFYNFCNTIFHGMARKYHMLTHLIISHCIVLYYSIMILFF